MCTECNRAGTLIKCVIYVHTISFRNHFLFPWVWGFCYSQTILFQINSSICCTADFCFAMPLLTVLPFIIADVSWLLPFQALPQFFFGLQVPVDSSHCYLLPDCLSPPSSFSFNPGYSFCSYAVPLQPLQLLVNVWQGGQPGAGGVLIQALSCLLLSCGQWTTCAAPAHTTLSELRWCPCLAEGKGVDTNCRWKQDFSSLPFSSFPPSFPLPRGGHFQPGNNCLFSFCYDAPSACTEFLDQSVLRYWY